MFFFVVETWHLSREAAKIMALCMQCEITSTDHLGESSARRSSRHVPIVHVGCQYLNTCHR